jgi:glutathione S-transferase
MPTLIIGNKTYSSWSLRPWLLLKQFHVAFEDRVVPLDTDEFRSSIGALSPSKRVPALHDGDLIVWDSLAICEYVNERWLDGRGWPRDPKSRAYGRSLAAEMHSGFAAMRNELSMNVLRVNRPRQQLSADAQADIARVEALWREALGKFDGPFLLGEFSIADAMYAPVMYRFRGYGIALDAELQRYADRVRALPALSEWEAAAALEPKLQKYEQLD